MRRGDIEALLVAKERDGFSPQTVNHVRAFLVRAFSRAKKADKWLGGNPAEETDTRRVPERIVDILTSDEVLPFFAALAPHERPVFAAAILTGWRKGELCGLRKDDIDQVRRLLYVRRSYDRSIPKSKKQRVGTLPRARGRYLPGPMALSGRGRCDANQYLAAGGHLTPRLQACRHGDRLPAQVPPKEMRPRGTSPGRGAAAPSAMRDEALAQGAGSENPLPRSP